MTEELVRRIQGGQLDARDFLILQLQAQGGDPSQLFEVLEDIVEHQRWNEIVDENEIPLNSLHRLLEAPQPIGCGVSAEKVVKLLDIEHRYEHTDQQWRQRMELLRQKVKQLLASDPEPSTHELEVSRLKTRGEAGRLGGRGRKAVDTSNALRQGGNSRDYLLARLKRDRPDLAARVIAGELSANAAAIEAGFRRRTYTIYPEDLGLTAKALRSRLSREECLHLGQMLLEDAE